MSFNNGYLLKKSIGEVHHWPKDPRLISSCDTKNAYLKVAYPINPQILCCYYFRSDICVEALLVCVTTGEKNEQSIHILQGKMSNHVVTNDVSSSWRSSCFQFLTLSSIKMLTKPSVCNHKHILCGSSRDIYHSFYWWRPLHFELLVSPTKIVLLMHCIIWMIPHDPLIPQERLVPQLLPS